jgi:isopenicillin N synthase-like dioxygenase
VSSSIKPGTVPLLDLSRFDAGVAQRSAFLTELCVAAHEVGFFYVTGHGMDQQLQRDLMDLARQFFALPEARQIGASRW